MKHWDIIIDLLKKNPPKRCAEIGVWKGNFTVKVLRQFPQTRLYFAIDLWEHYDDFTAILDPAKEMANCDFNKVYNDFKSRVKHYDNVRILRKTSKEASKLVKNLDFVFIDANHAYKYIKEDIKLWLPRMNKGGLISGHDYGNKRFGVTQAVNELLPEAKSKGTVWYMRVKQ